MAPHANTMATHSDGIFGTTIEYPTTDSAWQTAVKSRSRSIYEQRRFLSIVLDHHEHTIRKRWTKKSRDKRIGLLRASCPYELPETHREDFQHWLWVGFNRTTPDPELYHLFLCTAINAEDLCRPGILSILLEARVRGHPQDFVTNDANKMTLGQDLKIIPGPNLVSLDSSESVLVFRQAERPEDFTTIARANSMRPLHDVVVVPIAKGLVILEAQDRIMTFLARAVRNILHDVDVDQLPMRSSAKIRTEQSVVPREDIFSMDSDSTSTVALADYFSLEGEYSSPGESYFPCNIKPILTHKANEKRSDFVSLREDPGFYRGRVLEAIADMSEVQSELDGTANAAVITEELSAAAKSLQQWTHLDIAYETAFRQLAKVGSDQELFGAPFEAVFEAASEARTRALQITRGVLQHIASMAPLVYSARPHFRDCIQKCTKSKRINIMHCHENDAPYMLAMQASAVELSLLHLSGLEGHMMAELTYFLHYGPGKHLSNYSRLPSMVSDISLAMICHHDSGLVTASGSFCTPSVPGMDAAAEALLKRKGPDSVSRTRTAIKHKVEMDDHLIRALGDTMQTLVLQHGIIAGGKFDYPLAKKPTATSVATLQRSERNLDILWKGIDGLFKQFDAERRLDAIWSVLDAPRKGYRTSDWQPKASSQQGVQPEATVGIEHRIAGFDLPFRALSPVEDRTLKTYRKAKVGLNHEDPRDTKHIKPSPANQEAIIPAEETISVDKQTLETLAILFYVPGLRSQPGEMPWKDFLHAMDDMGFQGRNLLGSAWVFTRTGKENQRRIHVHEPHPSSKVRFEVARGWGRRLRDAYGWSIDTFKLNNKQSRGNGKDNATAD